MGNPRVAYYIEHLKDKEYSISKGACKALAKLGVCAVPALLEELKDDSVRHKVVDVLGSIGDSHTLPRKILADPRFSAQERIDILEKLRRVPYKKGRATLRYTFPDTRALCQAVLHENDAKVREGAQIVLDSLNRTHLLRASQPDTVDQAEELLRAYEGGTPVSRPETLLRAANESE